MKRKAATILLSLSSILFLTTCSQKGQRVDEEKLFETAKINGKSAQEGFIRCKRFVEGWLKYADEETGLLPRNLQESNDFWNARDVAADNYPFMVLTSYFVDKSMYQGTMMDILNTEKRLTSRLGSLPDNYSFSKNGFQYDKVRVNEILFESSEYVKDGLLPITELLGDTPWQDRMMDILNDMSYRMTVAKNIKRRYGHAPREEVNGELLQVLSRIYWKTRDEKYLKWAIKIGDFYLKKKHHPTNDLKYLRLRDHGGELISGLCELYATLSFARPNKAARYKEPLYDMLDKVLEIGRNEDGMFYNGIQASNGEIIHNELVDSWGYVLNGYYTVYLIDSKPEYLDPVLKLFKNLPKYRNYPWEGDLMDGYADAIESALNLNNRIHDPEVYDWIDSEIKVMWSKQQPDGIIEGWHADGNFARTTLMYNLWKSKGTRIEPWDSQISLGAESVKKSLYISLTAEDKWTGKLYFDTERSKEHLNLPLDWPRINQFPEWFTIKPNKLYEIQFRESKKTMKGSELMKGLELTIQGEERIVVTRL